MSDSFCSDDDDLILELGSLNTAGGNQSSSIAGGQESVKVALHEDSDANKTRSDVLWDTPNLISSPGSTEKPSQSHSHVPTGLQALTARVRKAQGEASMLRDKIALLNLERDRERSVQEEQAKRQKESHEQEMLALKQELQRLEDEKKFLSMEARKPSSAMKSTPLPGFHATPESRNTSSSSKLSTFEAESSPSSKKRKTENTTEPSRPLVVLNFSRRIPDENSLFYDHLILHRIVGCEYTTMEILSVIKLEYIEVFHYKTLIIKRSESIGRQLMEFILRYKQSMPLDAFVDTLLEHLAVLVTKISVHQQELKMAVPFLIALINQVIIFRPSAVQYTTLKEIVIFIADLIKTYQHVLKQPLYGTLEVHQNMAPDIFQYELIDILIILYSFDALESSFQVLQVNSNVDYAFFFDSKVLKAVESTYRLSLTISYKPLINVIFSTIVVLDTISNLAIVYQDAMKEDNVKSTINDGQEKLQGKPPLIDSIWWRDCVTRLYYILSKEINNGGMFDENSQSLTLSKYANIFSLNRNMGDNFNSQLLGRLVHIDKLQSIPRVILKDEVVDPKSNEMGTLQLQLERWFLELKDSILDIFGNLTIIYPNNGQLINGEMFVEITKLLSREQELVITRFIGQTSFNLSIRCRIIEHCLSLLYRLWMEFQDFLKSEQVDSVENELVMSLWRIVVPGVQKERRTEMDLTDHRALINEFANFHIKDETLYFNDAFEDMPDFIERELNTDLNKETLRIMQSQSGTIYQEMAKAILESRFVSLASVEDLDSLYIAMGVVGT